MCRLFSFSFKENTKQQDRLDLISSFRKLATCGMVPKTIESGHYDGWGISLYTKNEELPILYKSISTANNDKDFKDTDFFKENQEESGLIHLRKKTVGETSISNTHPFVEGIYSFIHNGTIEKGDGPYKELNSLCKGATDSEKLFRKFLQIKENKNTLEAFLEMLKTTKENYPTFSAINSILHDGKSIYISRVMNTKYPEYIPWGLEDYYTLYVGKSEDGDIIVSSEKINYKNTEYFLLPNDSVCVIALETGNREMVSL